MSFVAALLVKDCVVALTAAGLDPHVGLFHQPRFGRPSLALDLMEEMRPLVLDSVVLKAINNGEVGLGDSVGRAGMWSLTAAGRKKVIASYERRLHGELIHPRSVTRCPTAARSSSRPGCWRRRSWATSPSAGP